MITWGAALHWSYGSRAWLGFFAPLPNGQVLVRHELTFIRTAPEDAAIAIRAFLARTKIAVPAVIAQPDLFPSKDTRGQTVSQTFHAAGVPLRPADADAVNGWSRVRSWLALRAQPDGTQIPGLLIHSDCTQLIRTLPTIVADDANPDDIADSADANPAKGLRYYLMSRPRPWQDAPREAPGPGTWGHALRHLGRAPRRRVVGDCLVER